MERALEQEAVLVTYTSRQWPGRKQAKDANKAVSEKYGSDEEATKTTKYLVDPAELSKNAKYFNAAYTFYRELTLPWQDTKGAGRLLPGKAYPMFKTGIDARIKAALDRADEFSLIYPRLIDEYRPRLSGIFNPADYPRPEKIRDEFSIFVNPQPLPLSPASLTLKFLGADELRKMRNDLAGQWQTAEQNAIKDLYNRLYAPVKAMADKLMDPDGKFKDSLVNNISEVAELLPTLNFADDPELDRLAREIRERLTAIDPETLRINRRVRKQVATEAADLLQQITGAGARFIDLGPDPAEAQEDQDQDSDAATWTGSNPEPTPVTYQAAGTPGTTPSLF